MMNRPRIERISTFILRSAVFFIVVSFFLRALSEVSSRGLGLFVDLVSAALALIPAMSAVVYLHFRRQLPFGKLLCILSLPVGLLYTGVGLLGMAAFANDYRLIGPSAAILLLPALYGGVLAAVGHLWNDGEFDLSDNNISFVELCFLQTIFLALTIWAIDNAIGLSVLSDLRVPALFLSLFILAIYLARDRDSPIATTIADASLAGVLLCLVVCLQRI